MENVFVSIEACNFTRLIIITVSSVFCNGKKYVTRWFTNTHRKEALGGELRENDCTLKCIIFDDDLETDYVDLSDFEDDSSDQDTCNTDDDGYKFEFIWESEEETKMSFNNQGSFVTITSIPFFTQNQHLSNTDLPSRIRIQKERERKVFCDSCLSDDADDDRLGLDSTDLDSSLDSLKHGNLNDSLQVSSKVTPWNAGNNWIEESINDIVFKFYCRLESPEVYESSRKSTEHYDPKSESTYSKETVSVASPQNEWRLEVGKAIPKKRQKSGRRWRNKRWFRRNVRHILTWQTSLRRNTTVLYDVLPGTTNGKIALHQMAYRGSNENCEDSRGVVNGFVAETQPQIAGQRKPSIERDHLHANGVQETLEIPLGHQNGIVDYKSTQIVDNKSTQIVDNKSTQATEEGDRENGATYSSPLQSASASNGFSLTTTETLSSFFDSVSLLSVGEDEALSFEWIRLKTFSDWPIKSIFSTTLARNGWVSLGEGDRARCYSCHVVHEGWRIGDDPDQYHSPNCQFKSGQSNNIPISRGTSNQTPNLGQISQDHQQFHSHGNPLYTGNLSGAASSVGHPGPVQGVSQQGLNRPQQDSFLPRESNIQQQETNLRSQENYPLPQGNLTRPQEIYPQPQETRETNTAAMIGNQNVTPSQQLSAGLPNSEVSTATTPRNTDTCRNTGTPTPQVPTDNLHSTAAAEAPSSHSKEAQLEALKRDPMGINFDRPKYPSYAILAVRISSYTDWPAAMTQTPRDMALAGFFYAGYGDYTRCFFCGGGLRNWEAGDDPWVEHARWFKKCAFVRQNRGQEFIDLVQKRAAELDEQGNQEEMGNTQTNTAISDPNSAQAKEEKVMRSPAVTTIKEMGYSEEKIKAAIHTIKSRLPRGKHKVSAQEILEVIFELNQSESGTPVGQSERVSENPTNNTNQSDSVAENTTHHMSQSDPALEGNQNAASAMDASNADQTSLDDHENRNSLQNPIFDELTSLKQENSSLKDQIICKICMEKNVSIAFLPCGHLACCEDCAPAMRKCPICREFVRGTVKTFLV